MSIASLVMLSSCASSFPEPAASAGANYPTAGVPVSVAWASDWLEGFVGESEAAGGEIVGLHLEYVEDRWVWRVRSIDPGRDAFGETVTEPDRGREALVDASSLTLLERREVTLSDAELATEVGSAYEAAQLSGEVYPSPRLIALEKRTYDDRVVWMVTTVDTETGAVSEVALDATAFATR